jgi:peptidyl-tRNA hydrolase
MNAARLFLITREDLSAGAQAVQAAHALREFSAKYPEEDQHWYKSSNTLIMKVVPNEPELLSLLQDAENQGIKVVQFREPDRGDELTALALAPDPRTELLCRGHPLALKGR